MTGPQPEQTQIDVDEYIGALASEFAQQHARDVQTIVSLRVQLRSARQELDAAKIELAAHRPADPADDAPD